MKRTLILTAFVALLAFKTSAQTHSISAIEASKLIGQNVSVTDSVKGYKVVNDGMTLLDLGQRYPNQALTIVMKGHRFFKPTELLNKLITAHGLVVDYKGKPEIIVNDPEMLSIRKTDTLGNRHKL